MDDPAAASAACEAGVYGWDAALIGPLCPLMGRKFNAATAETVLQLLTQVRVPSAVPVGVLPVAFRPRAGIAVVPAEVEHLCRLMSPSQHAGTYSLRELMLHESWHSVAAKDDHESCACAGARGSRHPAAPRAASGQLFHEWRWAVATSSRELGATNGCSCYMNDLSLAAQPMRWQQTPLEFFAAVWRGASSSGVADK